MSIDMVSAPSGTHARRSGRGHGTKTLILADSNGRAVGFVLAPGQAHEAPLAPALLDMLADGAGWVVADRGYSSDAIVSGCGA